MKTEEQIREALAECEDFLFEVIEREDYEELPTLGVKIRLLKWVLK